MIESAFEVVSIPAKMNVLNPAQVSSTRSGKQRATHDIWPISSCSGNLSASDAAMFALTKTTQVSVSRRTPIEGGAAQTQNETYVGYS